MITLWEAKNKAKRLIPGALQGAIVKIKKLIASKSFRILGAPILFSPYVLKVKLTMRSQEKKDCDCVDE